MANLTNERWYFTKEQLENTPSRRCGYDSYKELSCRQQAANFIQDMGQRLKVSQLCINTAIVYMHRFYVFHSFTMFPWHQMAGAALFLAAKVEEQPRKLEYVARAANICRNTKNVNSDMYITQTQDLVTNENILLQTLGFDFEIEHPHTHVLSCCHLVRAGKDLAQTSYFMASNSLHLTTMCIQYKPTLVACFCILIACKWSNWEIPLSNEGKEWFTYVDPTVTAEQLQQLTEEFMAIFEACPSRLKDKVMANAKTATKTPSMPVATIENEEEERDVDIRSLHVTIPRKIVEDPKKNRHPRRSDSDTEAHKHLSTGPHEVASTIQQQKLPDRYHQKELLMPEIPHGHHRPPVDPKLKQHPRDKENKEHNDTITQHLPNREFAKTVEMNKSLFTSQITKSPFSVINSESVLGSYASVDNKANAEIKEILIPPTIKRPSLFSPDKTPPPSERPATMRMVTFLPSTMLSPPTSSIESSSRSRTQSSGSEIELRMKMERVDEEFANHGQDAVLSPLTSPDESAKNMSSGSKSLKIHQDEVVENIMRDTRIPIMLSPLTSPVKNSRRSRNLSRGLEPTLRPVMKKLEEELENIMRDVTIPIMLSPLTSPVKSSSHLSAKKLSSVSAQRANDKSPGNHHNGKEYNGSENSNKIIVETTNIPIPPVIKRPSLFSPEKSPSQAEKPVFMEVETNVLSSLTLPVALNLSLELWLSDSEKPVSKETEIGTYLPSRVMSPMTMPVESSRKIDKVEGFDNCMQEKPYHHTDGSHASFNSDNVGKEVKVIPIPPGIKRQSLFPPEKIRLPTEKPVCMEMETNSPSSVLSSLTLPIESSGSNLEHDLWLSDSDSDSDAESKKDKENHDHKDMNQAHPNNPLSTSQMSKSPFRADSPKSISEQSSGQAEPRLHNGSYENSDRIKANISTHLVIKSSSGRTPPPADIPVSVPSSVKSSRRSSKSDQTKKVRYCYNKEQDVDMKKNDKDKVFENPMRGTMIGTNKVVHDLVTPLVGLQTTSVGHSNDARPAMVDNLEIKPAVSHCLKEASTVTHLPEVSNKAKHEHKDRMNLSSASAQPIVDKSSGHRHKSTQKDKKEQKHEGKNQNQREKEEKYKVTDRETQRSRKICESVPEPAQEHIKIKKPGDKIVTKPAAASSAPGMDIKIKSENNSGKKKHERKDRNRKECEKKHKGNDHEKRRSREAKLVTKTSTTPASPAMNIKIQRDRINSDVSKLSQNAVSFPTVDVKLKISKDKSIYCPNSDSGSKKRHRDRSIPTDGPPRKIAKTINDHRTKSRHSSSSSSSSARPSISSNRYAVLSDYSEPSPSRYSVPPRRAVQPNRVPPPPTSPPPSFPDMTLPSPNMYHEVPMYPYNNQGYMYYPEMYQHQQMIMTYPSCPAYPPLPVDAPPSMPPPPPPTYPPLPIDAAPIGPPPPPPE